MQDIPMNSGILKVELDFQTQQIRNPKEVKSLEISMN